MPTQNELIKRFESVPLPELSKIIHRPTAEEAAALKVWLGPERYESLRATTLQPRSRSRGPEKRRNVVVLHGIMGAELSVRDGNDDDKIWVGVWNILRGRLKELRMNADGQPERPSFASDMMRKFYVGMLTGLARDHNVQAFWYDWRRDLKDSAAALDKAVQQWFGASSEVYFVAHSMGGLVVRTWIRDFGKRWDKGCRLVMLGTPNHGSFAIPQVITGAHKLVRKLAMVDLPTKLGDFTQTLNTFPGSLQMLPSPLVMATMEPLYRATTWPERGVTQKLLDRAMRHHESLAGIVDIERMTYIAGVGHETPCDFRDWKAMDRVDEGYLFTPEGDGTVPHKLGFLKNDAGKVPVHFSRAEHGKLPNDTKVIAAVSEYLADGTIQSLEDKLSLARQAGGKKASGGAVEAQWQTEITDFAARLQKSRSRSPQERSPEELRLEESLLAGFLGDGPVAVTRGIPAINPTQEAKPKDVANSPKPNPIRIDIQCEDIAKVGGTAIKGQRAVDYLAVGHYQGVEPQFAERALDIRLSKALELIPASEKAADLDRSRLFITRATRRGSITMKLGEPWILPMPGGPVIALAGLGHPGTFGPAELNVMVREFLSTLADLRCRHLGTVLIGAGAENMDIPTACRIWLKALHALATSGNAVVPHITFVQNSPGRALAMHREFTSLIESEPEWATSLRYSGVSPEETLLARREKKEIEEEFENRASAAGSNRGTKEVSPSFINVSRVRGGFEFSAITNSASIPQRIIEVDPSLIEEVSGRLATSIDIDTQQEWGCVLEQLLIPRDLRSKMFSSAAPVVFAVDASSARIPFEMLVLPPDAPVAADSGAQDPRFLGLASNFGVTRQFRTTFAPAPEPPRGGNETLRVLIIADPAEDAPLDGAQEEAAALEDIVNRLNNRLKASGKEIKVDSLIGPAEATRANVLKMLLRVRYDAVHFAGHCFYDKVDPAESGWLFHEGRNERITAAELSRLDRVPPFVFSNACESGMTPDRFGGVGLGLAPAFAEAFFQRGVRNFICTAWPVDDADALLFATTFYEALLGLRANSGGVGATIREAMTLARQAIAIKSSPFEDTRTWGAYQHYGNPSFRFMK